MYVLLIAATAPPVSRCHEDPSAAVECMCYCSGFPVLSLGWVVPVCSGAWMEVAGSTFATVCIGVLPSDALPSDGSLGTGAMVGGARYGGWCLCLGMIFIATTAPPVL